MSALTGREIVISIQDVRRALNAIKVGGRLKWGWAWSTEARPGGWLIRVGFDRPDRNDGAWGRGFGRWYWIETGATTHDVARTGWIAIRAIVEHELAEWTTFDGHRGMDPHAPVFGDLP